MDSKTIKNNLKQAKEAIKNKDISTALNLCKAVLKADRNNYIGLVLFGAALQESKQKDQAPNAYRKAIEVSPDQPLAWQGLAAFYEKDDASKHAEQLVPVYVKLLEIESETPKWCEIIRKVKGVITKFAGAEYLAQILESNKNTEDNSKLSCIHELTLHYLSEADEVPEKYLQLFQSVIEKNSTNEDGQESQVYINLLYDQKKFRKLLEYTVNLYKNDCQNVSAAEWLCKVISEQYVESRCSVTDWCPKAPEFYAGLLQANQDNVVALMAKGTFHMYQRAYLEARDTLKHCLSLSPGLFHALCLLAEAYVQLLCAEEAVQVASTASTLRPQHVFPKAVLAKALSMHVEPDRWEEAVRLATEVLSSDESELAAEGLCEAYLRLERWPDLLTAVDRLSHAPELAALLRLEADTQGELLSRLAHHTPDCPLAWYRLGQLYLAGNSADLACTAFLKCARLAPHWYTAYLQLGHLYARNDGALDKARRCYQRALVLNPAHTPTYTALSDTYQRLGDTESNVSLLRSVCERAGGRWAWPRLGLLYTELGDITAAISCLRSALKTDHDNHHLWEALADAYLARGANGSALKSYQKVLELEPDAFYPALQIAAIKRVTDELADESLTELRGLVARQPESVLALKGLCETCLCLAKTYLTRRLLGLSRDRLQEGLSAITDAVRLRPELACLWKLAGDCLTLGGSLPRTWNIMEVTEPLRPTGHTTGDHLEGLQLLELGARCMCRSLKLMTVNTALKSGPGESLVWHDLALNYRQQAALAPDNAASISAKALAAAKESVTLAPQFWQHWNQLGIVAAMPDVKNYALAQHSFIKATILDESVAIPWANLGCLYLTLNELKLANSSFSAAQRIDPEYCQSWIGQALIAEQVNNEETMDLFRHTTQLGYHIQSSVGYAQWVCQTLQLPREARTEPHYAYCIERMHAVPVAVDALTWATDEYEDDACALNMLGCLLERQGLHRWAVEVLSRAVDHCPAQHKDKALANFGRVLLSADKVDDAIQVYSAITQADIHSQCGLALALYKGKQYAEAYEAYEAALNWWAADDAVKADLYVAMAAVAYKMSGADQAKTLLLQGNQLKPTSVHGLFAACALGMLNSDLELSKLALKDMTRYQNHPDYVSHIALFQAYTKFIQGEIQESVWSMSRTVHRMPDVAELWLHLAVMILNRQSVSPSRDTVAAHCARTAMALGRTCMDVSKVMAVVSLSQLMGGEVRRALSASQHAVHLYPAVGESWAVLAASCLAADTTTPLRPLISHARQHIDLERPLAKWMSTFERKIAMLAS